MFLKYCLAALLAARAAAVVAAETLSAEHAAQMAKGTELFNASVSKLLADHCVKCHGGEKGTKGGLDLATRELLIKGGENGAAIVPGKSAESLLVKSIRHEDPDLKMPKKADKLPEDAIAKIAAWIDLGAPYAKPLIDGKPQKDRSVVADKDRKWWAFQPLTRPAPPEIRNQKSEPSGARQTAAGSPQGEAGGPNQIRNPIDAFLIAAQQAKGVAMNPPAPRRALIRRAYLDVIGLPPTPEQVEAFVNDKSSDAWAKVVDALLASPHYGERWGRHWLDLARYAESHGYEQDYDRPNAWHYRDFVIRALNADQPFDEFVRWQIAGDELAPENPDAWKATGFLAAGTHATQITANQAEKERYDELDDLAQTIGTSMLGLTIGCARCHDHKYDPIPTTDYYRFISTFTTTVRSDYDIDVDPAKYNAAKVAWDTAHARLVAARDLFEKEQLSARLAVWEKSGARPQPAKWLVLDNAAAKSEGGATFTKQSDGSFLASGRSVEHDTYVFTAPAPATGITAVKLDALADESFVKSGPGRADNGNFALSHFELSVGGQPAKFARALADFEQNGLPVAAAIDADPMSSWAVDPQFGKNHSAVFVLERPLATAVGTRLTFTLKFTNNTKHSIGRPRLAVTTDANPSLEGASSGSLVVEAIRVLERPPAQRSADETAKLLAWYRTEDAEWKKLDAAVEEHARTEPKPEKVKALICSEGVPALRLHTMGPDFYEKTFLLQRGDLNQKLNEASQGFLTVVSRGPEERWIAPPPAGSRTPLRRSALAKWITDADAGAGALLARVAVNRLWQHHFGRGIVATPSDFGAQGDRPAHPELLDFLADELVHSGWRLKSLHRLMLMSAAYTQSTAWDAQRNAIDPDNTLVWRRKKQRLEGEVIRDSILAVTGALDATMFGAGILDAGMKRRSIYFQIKRSQLPPMLITFDGPDTLNGLGQRAQTTVAPQALLLMNNQLIRASVLDWAKALAPLAPEAVVQRTYLAALSRPPTDGELATAADFLRTQKLSYESAATRDAAHLALADFCQVVLSMNEFVYVE